VGDGVIFHGAEGLEDIEILSVSYQKIEWSLNKKVGRKHHKYEFVSDFLFSQSASQLF
jgi:hypothetical protein